MGKFYVTTPIYYVNDEPHIGHAYTTILADVLARYHRSLGDEVFFLTGTDEHGQKIKEAADKRGVTPQDHVDQYVTRFKILWEKLHIQYDDFIRTTEPRHTDRVREMLQNLWEQGEIYADEYEGYYSVSEERFITEKELESGEFREIKKLKEKNYFFRMSKYQDALISHIKNNPRFILPESRRNEILGFLREPLGDLCISRPKARMSWGIELPFDKEYVTYVWFDALLNYITAVGWNSDSDKFDKWWPANFHLMGKDILTTHAVYWPTMLMAAGIPLPKSILAHGWWLVSETKMSKSLGNVVRPLDLVDEYGVDPVRYYLMRDMVLGLDSNFSMASFVKRYNSDLANDFGNLVNRVSILIRKHFDSCIPESGTHDELDQALIAEARHTPGKVKEYIAELRINDAIETTMGLIRKINKYLEQREPWKQVKIDKSPGCSAGTTLALAADVLRIGGQLLFPVMPNRVGEILKILGADRIPVTDFEIGRLQAGLRLGEGKSPFPRIDAV